MLARWPEPVLFNQALCLQASKSGLHQTWRCFLFSDQLCPEVTFTEMYNYEILRTRLYIHDASICWTHLEAKAVESNYVNFLMLKLFDDFRWNTNWITSANDNLPQREEWNQEENSDMKVNAILIFHGTFYKWTDLLKGNFIMTRTSLSTYPFDTDACSSQLQNNFGNLPLTHQILSCGQLIFQIRKFILLLSIIHFTIITLKCLYSVETQIHYEMQWWWDCPLV